MCGLLVARPAGRLHLLHEDTAAIAVLTPLASTPAPGSPPFCAADVWLSARRRECRHAVLGVGGSRVFLTPCSATTRTRSGARPGLTVPTETEPSACLGLRGPCGCPAGRWGSRCWLALSERRAAPPRRRPPGPCRSLPRRPRAGPCALRSRPSGPVLQGRVVLCPAPSRSPRRWPSRAPRAPHAAGALPGAHTHVLKRQEALDPLEQRLQLHHGALRQAVGLQVPRRPVLLVRLAQGAQPAGAESGAGGHVTRPARETLRTTRPAHADPRRRRGLPPRGPMTPSTHPLPPATTVVTPRKSPGRCPSSFTRDLLAGL